MDVIQRIRLHRFRDCVAFHTNAMDHTEYMTAAMARDMAAELLNIAKSIETEKFTESTVGSSTIEHHNFKTSS